MNTLIISDDFLEPPSELSVVRTITMLVHYNLGMNVLYQTTQELKDTVYHFAKPLGLMDFVDAILNEFEWEDGIRLDVLTCYPNTIVVKSLRIENQLLVLGMIKSMSGK